MGFYNNIVVSICNSYAILYHVLWKPPGSTLLHKEIEKASKVTTNIEGQQKFRAMSKFNLVKQ